ncbi:dirigent protein 23-like [Tripterygium wilfordii]|uniref:dirigent protein 23-like n=1 Tax=Tripterygium wilfordii TaxID=458696 RepID=UPI0018F80186|nr:dirigent protein 23-like [Tripterygium wilfordii]
MAKLHMCLVLMIVLVSITKCAQAEKKWARKVVGEKETTINLQFYLHDTLSGKNPSAILVAQAKTTYQYPTQFGSVMMADDPLTMTPEPNSLVVGRAHGLYGSAGQTDLALIMALSFHITSSAYVGSTINILGKNSPDLNANRELPVVGGTGAFRLARGYAYVKLLSIDPKTGDTILGYNITIVQ